MKKLILNLFVLFSITVLFSFLTCAYAADANIKENPENGNQYVMAYSSNDDYTGGETHRPIYESKNIKIIDHVVYEKAAEKYGNYYMVIDYFDTDEARNEATEINIVDYIDGVPVEMIRVYPYAINAEVPGVTSITLPDTLVALSATQFQWFDNVKSIELPESMIFMGQYSLKFDGVKTLTIPKNVTAVARGAFDNSESLEKVVFEADYVSSIEYSAFRDCVNLKTVDMNFTGSTISAYAFENCESLTYFDLSTVLRIKSGAFWNSGLTSVELQAHVNYIGGVFKNCTKLKTVTFLEGYYHDEEEERLYYHDDMFKGCTSIESVYINYVGDDAGEYIMAHHGNIKGCFLSDIPKTATVYVKTTQMKKAVKDKGYKGKVKVKVDVDKPENLTAVQKDSSITISWDKVSGATGYSVYQYSEKTGKYEKLAAVKTDSYTVKNLKAGQTYKFAVRAYKKIDGDNSWSAYAKLTAATKPAKVTGLKATQTTNSITLSWKAVSGATGYQIYWYKSDKWSKVETVYGENTVTIDGLISANDYDFRVRAFVKAGGKTVFGSYSTVLGTATKPETPGITVYITKANKAEIHFGYHFPYGGNDGYKIYVAEGKNGKYKLVEIASSGPVYVKGLVESGKTYYFKVKAYKRTNSGTIYSDTSPAFEAKGR